MDNVYNPTPYIRKALQDAPKKVDPPTNGVIRHHLKLLRQCRII